MKAQRVIHESFNSLRFFTVKEFYFTNFKFLDLNKEIPKHEFDEFSVHERAPDKNFDQVYETNKNVMGKIRKIMI
jgi:hypothetical protein